MSVTLRQIPLPTPETSFTRPDIPAAEYDQRMQRLYDACGVDWVIVYGDREHAANLTFLTGYDPRFEEGLLVLGAQNRRVLIVGNEGQGYATLLTCQLEIALCESLSLSGQPRQSATQLRRVLSTIGITSRARVGIVGWKYFEADEDDDPSRPAFVPAFLVNALESLIGADGQVQDVTATMMHPEHGLRTINSAAQVAAFEWAAVQASVSIMKVVQGTRPGMTEYDSLSLIGYAGEPFIVHPMLASGSGSIIGLRSPASRKIAEGDGITTAISYRGSLCCRAGMVLSTPDTHFFENVVTPYFRAQTTWYEQIRVGITGGAIHDAVIGALAGASFKPLLNPGHLVDFEEWVHTPIREGSTDRLQSGMMLQCDIIPSPLPPGQSLNCEDTIALADASLRAELQANYPALWGRIQRRSDFMRQALGIHLTDDVLPLSIAPAYLPPFWLAADLVCTNAQ